MHIGDKIKRSIAFYFSLALFFSSLPVVLAYSLGYHVDFHAFKIYKTGIIYLKTRPSGASLYINGKLYPDLTPLKIEELKPGTYRVEVRRDGFYPWQKDLVVRPNMVTRVDDIVLFRLTQDMKKITDYEIVDFMISEKNSIYYMTTEGLFRSSMDGTILKKLSLHSNWQKDIIDKRFSPDGSNILYFNEERVWVISLDSNKGLMKEEYDAKVEELLRSPNPIQEVFWYSDSKHIVFITDKDINVAELGGGERNAVTLYRLNSEPKSLYYDEKEDCLYFTDLGKDEDEKEKIYLHRLDLRQKFFDQFIKRFKEEFNIRYEKK